MAGDVVVELSQMPDGDLRSARAVREGGRVSHGWCMCVVCRGCGGLAGGRDDCGGWYARRTNPGGWSHVGDAGALPECKFID